MQRVSFELVFVVYIGLSSTIGFVDLNLKKINSLYIVKAIFTASGLSISFKKRYSKKLNLIYLLCLYYNRFKHNFCFNMAFHVLRYIIYIAFFFIPRPI